MDVTLMIEMISRVENTEDSKPADEPTGLDGLEDPLITQLADRARTGGLQLTGEGGLLQLVTKSLLESAPDGEITDHLGYDKHNPAGRGSGTSRNPAPQRPSPTSGRWRSPCPATGTAASNRWHFEMRVRA